MSVQENKSVVRAFVDTWNRGDLDALAKLMAEDCRLTVSGQTISCSPESTWRIPVTMLMACSSPDATAHWQAVR